jgi:hypothetical protein
MNDAKELKRASLTGRLCPLLNFLERARRPTTASPQSDFDRQQLSDQSLARG